MLTDTEISELIQSIANGKSPTLFSTHLGCVKTVHATKFESVAGEVGFVVKEGNYRICAKDLHTSQFDAFEEYLAKRFDPAGQRLKSSVILEATSQVDNRLCVLRHDLNAIAREAGRASSDAKEAMCRQDRLLRNTALIDSRVDTLAIVAFSAGVVGFISFVGVVALVFC